MRLGPAGGSWKMGDKDKREDLVEFSERTMIDKGLAKESYDEADGTATTVAVDEGR